ncbi:MAG TPA: TAXI family TRAP transporter solute-binding subunit [Gemmataceae bacterium]|nr:TAXI family TRAP transporter solute-binding subunit [Gemmataceae bacterium]
MSTPSNPTTNRPRNRSKNALIVWGVIILICAAGMVGTYVLFVKAPPPSKIIIATGKESGAYYPLGLAYAEELKKEGLTVEVRKTEGAGENLQLLQDPHSGVSVAFLQSGVADPEAANQLQALGSLYREPLWVFYRGDKKITEISQLAGKRIGVGTRGSGTYPIASKLLAANGLPEAPDSGAEKQTVLVERDAAEAAKTLLKADGDLDAAFFVAAFKADYIQQLLNDTNLHLMSFSQQEAYHIKYRFMSDLTLPQGLVNLGKNVPAENISLLAPTAMLVTRKDVNPDLIPLLLTVAAHINGKASEFANPGEFPSASYTDIPVSPDAETYYKSGPPLLQRYLPFWLASLVDRLKVMLLPLIMLLLPLFRAAPPLVRWRTRRKIYRWYSDLREIDRKMAEGLSGAKLDAELARLRDISKQVAAVEVPLSYMEEFYHLRMHLAMLQEQMEKRKTQQGNGATAVPLSANAV